MTDLRIFDYKRYDEEMSIIIDRIKVDLSTMELIDSVVKRCLVGVYLRK